MRRASPPTTLAIAICLLLGALVPAAPAAAGPPRPVEELADLWKTVESGFEWLWGWVGSRETRANGREIRKSGTCSDPNGKPVPPGTPCPPPPPNTFSQLAGKRSSS
jgi:hypothetical protein